MLRTAGKTLYRLFFAPYTLKQWGVPATELAPSVCGRIPIRTNRDDSYLKESFQALPRDGYAGHVPAYVLLPPDGFSLPLPLKR